MSAREGDGLMDLIDFLFDAGHYEHECGCWADWGPNHLRGGLCFQHRPKVKL